MTELKKLELKSIIERQGYVEITVVPPAANWDEDSYEEQYNTYEEAIKGIEILEIENRVFF
jgi:hypothetical protein